MINNYGQNEYEIYMKMENHKDVLMGIFYAYNESEALDIFYERANIDIWERDKFYTNIKED